MALNYSQRPLFPAHISENNLLSPMRIVNGYLVEGAPLKNGEGYTRPCHPSLGGNEEWDVNCGRHRVERCCSPESNSMDIVDLLPSDPFGMDMKNTFTAITGWLEDLEVGYGGYMGGNSGRGSQENYDLFAGWNLIWNYALLFQPFPSNGQLNDKLNMGAGCPPNNHQGYERPCASTQSLSGSLQFDEKFNVGNVNLYVKERDGSSAGAPNSCGSQPACKTGEIMNFGNASASCSSELQFGEVEGSVTSGLPHEALIFALSYLEVKDLLSAERVCRSLCSTIRGDPLLWMSISIDQPLNERITDDLLVQLASRAQGNLQCLSLVECPKVTDDSVKRILEMNPRLTKLSVPGCTRISIEGILDNIRTYNSVKDVRGIKHLRIGGLYGVACEHFEELKLLMGAHGLDLSGDYKPHYYHRGNLYLPHDDDRAIDIETCPRCKNIRLVYDCPADGCRVKESTSEVCRACRICIPRCAQCGKCISDGKYEETFDLEVRCSDCCEQMPGYADRLDKKVRVLRRAPAGCYMA